MLMPLALGPREADHLMLMPLALGPREAEHLMLSNLQKLTMCKYQYQIYRKNVKKHQNSIFDNLGKKWRLGPAPLQ